MWLVRASAPSNAGRRNTVRILSVYKSRAAVQVYGGLVFMDLSAAAMKKGHGDYTYLSADALPPLWLIYTNIPSSSSKMHSPVKQRWLDGDQDVVSGMKELAELAKQGRCDIALPQCTCNKNTVW